VVVDDVNVETGEATVAEIVAAGGDAVFVRADVSDSDQVAELFARAEQAYGALDILMNNALCATQHVMDNDWQPQIDVIVKGTYECSLAAIERMQPNGRGSIVNISSVNGLFGLQGIHVYSAAKGAILALTKSMAVEQGKHGIRVNAICPGSIETEVWEPILAKTPGIWDDIAAFYPLGRLGTVDDIANCALFLASDEAAFATGAVFTIDGGLTAGNKDFPI
jgi:NAD(P)-dependent dehydrogenase (short-subunit alcohol dehydrogenase family)